MDKFLLILTTIFLCLTGITHSQQKHVEEGLRIIFEHAEACKEFNFRLFGYGGSFIDTINKLDLFLETPSKCDLNFSRLLMMELLMSFAIRVNQDEKVRSYLYQHPMQVSDLNLRILLGDFNTLSTQEDPKVAFIYNKGFEIIYFFRDKNTLHLEPFLRENFIDNYNDLQKNRFNSVMK